MLALNFASRDRLIDVPGMLLFSRTERLRYVANFTDTCPEMAPPGWNLYVGAAVPKPAIGDFDEAAEIDLLRADLREHVPGFDDARELSVAVMRDGWPPQRAVAGQGVRQRRHHRLRRDGQAGGRADSRAAPRIRHGLNGHGR